MTQEEKARAYDGAYKVAESIHRFSNNPAEIKRMEEISPELKESEDEKIRKHLIKHFRNKSKEDWNGVPVKSVLDWLEKQGQVKDYAISQHENKTCKENGNFLTSEDERIRKALLNEFIHLQSNGYKFAGLEGEEIIAWLENQKGQKPTEWNEEDNQTLGRIIAFLWFHRKGDTDAICQQEKDINWLKSIHPLKCWKPSIAQLIALHQAIKEVNKGTADVLKGLYQQLKAI